MLFIHRDVLFKLRKRVRKEQWDLWKNNSWICTRTTRHSTIFCIWKIFLRTSAFLYENILRILYISLQDKTIWSRSEKCLKGNTYSTNRRSTSINGRFVEKVTSDELHCCFENWTARMQRCIGREREYYNGIKVSCNLIHKSYFLLLFNCHNSYVI